MQLIIPRDPVNLINAVNPEGECPVCQVEFTQNEQGVVYHEKESLTHSAHLIHRVCLKNWCESRNPQELTESNCMTCAVPINVRPIFQLTRMQKLLRDSPIILAKALFTAYFSASMHMAMSLAFRKFYPYNLSANRMIATGQIVTRFLLGIAGGCISFTSIIKIGLKVPVFREYLISFLTLAINKGADRENDDANLHALAEEALIGLLLSLPTYLIYSNTSPTQAISNSGIITAVFTGVMEAIRFLETP